jgi:hypothetical protein
VLFCPLYKKLYVVKKRNERVLEKKEKRRPSA